MVTDNQHGGGPSLLGVDLGRPATARVYDYLLGGHHNFLVDRDAGAELASSFPETVPWIRENRSFSRRVVRHLSRVHGITQFIDLGSGIPTVGPVHETARHVNPDASVVYVDIDPVVVAHARHILRHTPNAVAMQGDLRDPASVLADPRLATLLDLTKPVAVLLVAVLHQIPDTDDPAGIVRGYLERVAPGSYLALTHGDWPDVGDREAALARYRLATDGVYLSRTRTEVASMLAGADLVPPGLVRPYEWHPDGLNADVPCLVALARKAPSGPAAAEDEVAHRTGDVHERRRAPQRLGPPDLVHGPARYVEKGRGEQTHLHGSRDHQALLRQAEPVPHRGGTDGQARVTIGSRARPRSTVTHDPGSRLRGARAADGRAEHIHRSR